ncbi:hypothetical protein KBY65_05855 [Cyanobium sp. Alchichica 3B3-8F6]|uniref:hypothetical protein n=1 Tax=Cyanobium sp. Alchichica 3B3-8F6 TaxID=2823696 RepID=UPI0020CCA184|nr:hypothetical protein [Cyanobium sp. Alchichica 3B3-8F6]MCP9882001.1 hypothetical protein [Cyanobium sp. Alchichica 3B3-8F6]
MQVAVGSGCGAASWAAATPPAGEAVDLIRALLALERAAADVESFIPADADDAALVELLDAWGPPRRRPNTSRTRELQLLDWVAWLKDCAMRWESQANWHTSPDATPFGQANSGCTTANGHESR